MDAVRFFYGAQSPYAWFAAERIDALLPQAEWRPLFAGGLFEATGRRSWGLDEEQRRIKLIDCEQRALERGLGPIHWPERWPTSDILVTRAMVFAEVEGRLRAFSVAAMRAAFTEGAELSDLSVLQRCGAKVELDPDRLAAAVQDAAVKAAVRDRNEEAVSLGVSGLPTVNVGGELFWGDDRLEDAAVAAIRRQP